LRRATSTISGEKSLEITRPPSPTRLGDAEAEVTRPGGDVEEDLAGLRIHLLQQPMVDATGDFDQPLTPFLPARRHLTPRLETLSPVSIEIGGHGSPPLFGAERREAIASRRRPQRIVAAVHQARRIKRENSRLGECSRMTPGTRRRPWKQVPHSADASTRGAA